MSDINYWAVLVGAVASMVLGFIWYMPAVLGNSWMTAIGKTKEQLGANANPMMYLGSYIMAAVTAYVLAYFFTTIEVATIGEAFTVAFWAWIGFVATVMAMNIMYEGRKASLFWINSIYHLLSFGVVTLILFYWQ